MFVDSSLHTRSVLRFDALATGGALTINNDGSAKTISFRFTNGSTTARTGQHVVIGPTTRIIFGPTGSWATWLNQNATVTLNNNTTNTIGLQSKGQDLDNIDQLTVP